jgi:hypothetical protein
MDAISGGLLNGGWQKRLARLLSALTACGIVAACHSATVPPEPPPRQSPPAPVSANPEQGFAAVIHLAETLLEVHAEPMDVGGELVPDAVMFHVNGGLDRVLDFHERLAAKGSYLFLLEPVQEHGPDTLGLVPTIDQFEVVRIVGTNGNGLHSSEEVLAWLRQLHQAQPFLLVGMGVDFVQGAFVEPVRDPAGMAHNVYAFCPDFWNQGLGLFSKGDPEAEIERYFAANQTFFFWWD